MKKVFFLLMFIGIMITSFATSQPTQVDFDTGDTYTAVMSSFDVVTDVITPVGVVFVIYSYETRQIEINYTNVVFLNSKKRLADKNNQLYGDLFYRNSKKNYLRKENAIFKDVINGSSGGIAGWNYHAKTLYILNVDTYFNITRFGTSGGLADL